MIYTGIKDVVEVNVPVYNNVMMKANLLMEQNVMAMMMRGNNIGGNNNNTIIKEQQQYKHHNNNNNPNIFKIQLNMDNKILSHVSFP